MYRVYKSRIEFICKKIKIVSFHFFIVKVKNIFNDMCYVFEEAITAYQIAKYLVFSWLEESVIRYNCIKNTQD